MEFVSRAAVFAGLGSEAYRATDPVTVYMINAVARRSEEVIRDLIEETAERFAVAITNHIVEAWNKGKGNG